MPAHTTQWWTNPNALELSISARNEGHCLRLVRD
jgi:hypothetical protein